MHTLQGLDWYGLYRGDGNYFGTCGICNLQLEDPIVTKCGHVFDFACVSVAVHDCESCPAKDCGKSLWDLRGSYSMPKYEELQEYGLRVGRMSDFRKHCGICGKDCRDPVITGCGHYFDYLCIKGAIDRTSGDGYCPVKSCGRDLDRYRKAFDHPAHFAQADQFQASINHFWQSAKGKVTTAQENISNAQKREASLAQRIRNMMGLPNGSYEYEDPQVLLRKQQKEQADIHEWQERRRKYQDLADTYVDGGHEEFLRDRIECPVHGHSVEPMVQIKTQRIMAILRDAMVEKKMYEAMPLPNLDAACRDIIESWRARHQPREGYRMYREDFMFLLRTGTRQILMSERYGFEVEQLSAQARAMFKEIAEAAADACQDNRPSQPAGGGPVFVSPGLSAASNEHRFTNMFG